MEPRVLIAGFDATLPALLKERLPGVTVEVTSELEGVLTRIQDGPLSLMVLDDALEGPHFPLLDTLRSAPHGRNLPIIFAFGAKPGGRLTSRLLRHYKVTSLKSKPLDPDDLATAIARILGVRVQLGSAERGPDLLAAVWDRWKEATLEQVKHLVTDCNLLVMGDLVPEEREEARRSAHMLAGSLGTFGFPNGSLIAQEIEKRLREPNPDPDRLCDLTRALEKALASPRLEIEGEAPVVLLISEDSLLGDRLTRECQQRGLRLMTEDTMALGQALTPLTILVDLQDSEYPAERLAAWSHCAPVLALEENPSLDLRVQLADAGCFGVLPRSTGVTELLAAAEGYQPGAGQSPVKIMAVDDDRQLLAILDAILSSEGMEVKTFSEPLEFFDELCACPPELALIDIDMPTLSGLDLCKAIRTEPLVASLPVICLSGYSDSTMVDRAYQAGVDDYLVKPYEPEHLITRVRNRLERTRRVRSLRDQDQATGLLNRRAVLEKLELLLQMAQRHETDFVFALLRVHEAVGPERLRLLGELLSNQLSGLDAAGRWSESQLVVGMFCSAQEAARRFEEWRREVGFSAGLARFPRDGESLEALRLAAETTLSRAKSTPSGSIERPPREENDLDVLLVEDDEALAEVLLAALEARGHQVRWVREAESAARLLVGTPSVRPRVLVVDDSLPGLGGLDLVRGLRVEDPRLVMVTMSARLSEEEIVEALELGVADHLVKPFNLSLAVRRLERLLE